MNKKYGFNASEPIRLCSMWANGCSIIFSTNLIMILLNISRKHRRWIFHHIFFLFSWASEKKTKQREIRDFFSWRFIFSRRPNQMFQSDKTKTWAVDFAVALLFTHWEEESFNSTINICCISIAIDDNSGEWYFCIQKREWEIRLKELQISFN